jgi:hypothetical protein
MRGRGSRSFAGLVAATVLVVGGGTVARADQPRILVLPFSGSVPDAPDGPARLTQVVTRAAGLTGADVVIGQASFADAAALAGCSEETADCFKLVADSLRVDEVVIGTVKPTPDGGSVTITLKHFQQGAVDEQSLTVAAGSIDEMVKRVAREVPRMLVPGGESSEPPPDRIPTTTPERAPVEPRSAPVEQGDRRPGRVGALPWVLIGSGAALAAAGGGFLYVARKKQDEVDGAAIRDADDFERLVDIEDKGERYTRIGQGLLIGGGVVLAGGVVWALVRRASGSGEASEPAMALDVAPEPGGLGFAFSGVW